MKKGTGYFLEGEKGTGYFSAREAKFVRINKRVILITIIVVILICCFAPGFIKLKRLHARKTELLNKIEELKGSNLRLEREEERLTSDPIYIEKMIRQKLGLSGTGETVYKVIPKGGKE